YFQNYASNISDQARRRAQQYAIEATKKEVNGNIQFSYQWQGAFQTWRELSLQSTAAEQNGDAAAVERYKQLQRRIEALSPLLGPDYLAPGTSWPDSAKYESETYLVEATRLSETYLAESNLGNFTDATADALVVQITLLTVSLSLYGLSMALKGRVRWLFITVGSGIVILCVLWLGWSMLELFIRPEVNTEAIAAYSEGVGLSYQYKYDEAIEKFTQAIEADPYYAKAYYERGEAYLDMNELDKAIVEMEEARNQGMDDVTTNWNLGWTYYLLGQYDNGIATNERILIDHPDVLGMRMNQAISYLSKGDLANSQTQYDLLIEEAQRQVNEAHQNGTEPPSSLWFYMDAGSIDLQNLIDTLEHNPKEWTQAPAQNLITGDQVAIRDFAVQQMIRLKETTTALEYTGQLPDPENSTQVEPFVFGYVTGTDDQGFITGFEPISGDVIPYGEDSFSVQFTYSGPAPKQMVWKVYVNGAEDQSLRAVVTDDLSSGNTWFRTFGYEFTNVFILSEGEYTVELFADNKLVQRGTFHVVQQ
ncbi:MAG TPA: tetratricopeptide repeat protein, partial [Anaerolineales bacterium]|nr:tetratricopeptide repeat protein [Anaerolineales bacterium]